MHRVRVVRFLIISITLFLFIPGNNKLINKKNNKDTILTRLYLLTLFQK